MTPFVNLFRFVSNGFLLIVIGFFGCRNTIPATIAQNDSTGIQLPGNLMMPFDTASMVYDGLLNAKNVIEFYKQRSHLTVWFEGSEISPLGDSMITFVNALRYYGLHAQDYPLHEILSKPSSPDWELHSLKKEALLTDVFFAISKDLEYGKLSQVIPLNTDSFRINLLQQVVKNGGLIKKLEQQEPTWSGYKALKGALKMMLDTLNSIEQTNLLFLSQRVDDLALYKKILSIELNLHRWRLEKRSFGQRYIYVNVPSFMLQVFEQDTVVLESRVIVGKRENPTPLFSSMVECFITYPYWHVPRKISIEEYLPVIQKDSTFLSRNNFDVLDRKGKILDSDSIDWSKFHRNNFPVGLRQREGRENSLGLLKFVFDNPYAVFLHDTNAKRLFRRDNRALSHGCIRMEKAVELAHYLMTDNIQKKSNSVKSYLDQEIRHTLNLNKPIPIHIRYFTSEVKNNILYEYPDIYGLDTGEIQLLDE